MPPFVGAVRWLIIINVAIFALDSLLIAFARSAALEAHLLFALTPGLVIGKGWIWQIVTYSFLHGGVLHILFNMLALWMFGSTMEARWGTRQFLEFYFFCVVGAALVVIPIAYAHVFGLDPRYPLVGASGGIFGVIVAFGVLYADAEVYLFPFPISLKAKYLVGILLAIAVLSALRYEDPGSAIAHLGGAFFGYAYLKFLPRRGMQYAMSEGYFGLRNRYHKWKRRQAAKKFEVYMRKHDRNEYFDEHGNYRDPNEPKPKDNGESGRGKWVN
jgi:membrane associated rhomboid family serine protease